MLKNLKIENIAIIENASIDFEENFNCMTGETGAGKSIVVDSINAVLGEKISRELIRTGENKATVSALFHNISSVTCNILSSLGIHSEEANSLLITRTMTRDGRNVCRVNGENVTVSMLKTIGLSLINIHGQSDNQALMSQERHCSFIDAVAGNEKLIEDYSKSYQKLIEIKNRIRELSADDALKARQMDLLRYQIDELEKANIRVGEWEELRSKKTIINNSLKLMESLNRAHAALSGVDDYPGAVSYLFDAAAAISAVAEFLPQEKAMAQDLNDIAYTVDSYSSDILSLMENSVFDESELADIEERLDLLYRLSKKYGDTEEEMILFLDKARQELHNITCSDEILDKLNEEYKICLHETENKAQLLSESRKKTALEFEEKIQHELNLLDMPNTVFSVKTETCPLSDTGIDNIAFYISANKGEEPKPLAKIASGGELSRIMLAIKSVLADKDDVDTLIFDEIDSGVSGRAAGKIAEKLCDVSRHRQVICITHLPVIASFADNHMRISKTVKGDKTYTNVTPLDKEGRTAELARIIGGNENDEAYRNSAERLIDSAIEYKGDVKK